MEGCFSRESVVVNILHWLLRSQHLHFCDYTPSREWQRCGEHLQGREGIVGGRGGRRWRGGGKGEEIKLEVE